MYDYIKGQLVYADDESIVVDNHGIGYRIVTSRYSVYDFQKHPEEATVYTELIVREDMHFLVGFSTRDELKLFQLLTSVSGVGTKVGVGILSSYEYQHIPGMIIRKDIKGLTGAHGVGKKTAERIILELYDKVSTMTLADTHREPVLQSIPTDGVYEDAVSALLALGYSKIEAERALKDIYHGEETVEQLLKAALSKLMRG